MKSPFYLTGIYPVKSNFYLTGIISLTAIFLGFFGLVRSAEAANIYVDMTLGSNITNGTYSITNRDNSGTDGDAYTTVQGAITAMNGGDDIFLRGGTYGPTQLTGNALNGAVNIPQAKDGSSDNWSSIQSYEGEWAILDGENVCDPTGAVLGYRGIGEEGIHDIKYWKFERLEIKNGASTDRIFASGIWASGGPFIIRYCYIHNNIADVGQNAGGIIGKSWNNSTVEYNYFKDNGTSSVDKFNATGGLYLYGDSLSEYEYWETAPHNINYANRKNEFRYNLFDNENQYAPRGYYDRSIQLLTPKTDVSWNYADYGNKIHHNIFLDFDVGIANQQDFQQIYNNIIVTPTVDNTNLGITIKNRLGTGNQVGVAVYNNTLIKGRINQNFGYVNHAFPQNVINPYAYIYNNLIDQAPADYGDAAVINMGDILMENPFPFTYDATRADITNNYLYRGDSTNLKVTRDDVGDCYQFLSVDEYNACYSETNYSKISSEGSDNIYTGSTGAEQYITRGTHTVSGGVTIADGGIGGNHPYLTGVTIPSYIGATNPDDNDWVNGVYTLNTTYMQNATLGSDPIWIEESGGSDTTPPSAPQGLAVQ